MSRQKTFIAALDPGDTSGWVRLLYYPKNQVYKLERWGTFDDLELEMECAAFIYNGTTHVATESYVIRPDTALANIGSSLRAVEVIGRMRLWAKRYGVEVHEQSASLAKQQWTNRRLKEHFPFNKLYPTGKARPEATSLCKHECDALRHAMTFIENHYKVQLVLDDPAHVL